MACRLFDSRPRPKLQLRPAPDGRFVVEKLTVWQKIKKRHAGFMDSHSALGVGLWSILFIVFFVALMYSVRVEEPVRGYIYIATGDDGSFGPGDTVAVAMTKGLFGMYHADSIGH